MEWWVSVMRTRSMWWSNRGVMVAGWVLGIISLAALPVAARGLAAESPRVSASLHPMPATGGWMEVRLVVRTGDEPWRGLVEVAGGAAKVHVRLAVVARGQRVVPLPFWVGPGNDVPQVWLNGVPAGRALTPPVGGNALRVLVAEGPGVGASEAGLADDMRSARSPVAAWPETWRAYDAFDLVILPAGLERALRPEQDVALEQWMRWGGAVAAVQADRGEPVTRRVVDAGVGILAESPEKARAAYAKWAASRVGKDVLPHTILRAWERARPWGGRSTWQLNRPGARLGMALVIYLALLVGSAAALSRFPVFAWAGVRTVLVLVGVAILAMWGLSRGGGPFLEVQEVTLLRAHAHGNATHMSTVIRAQADRRATSRFVPLFSRPLLYEAEPSRERSSPHRAIRWDVDGGVWERSWAVGETGTIRADGIGPDIAVRAQSLQGAGAWEIDNRGSHTLRSAGLLFCDGGFQPVPDVPPGTRTRLVGVELAGAGAQRGRAPEIWQALLPACDPAGGWQPVLVAALDPPIPAVRFLKGEARASSETRLVMTLPGASGS